MEQQAVIASPNGKLAATIHRPPAEGNQTPARKPLVIICHGFLGNRIGVDRLFVKTARALSSSGFLVIRFDYAGCGESEGDYGRGGLHELIAETRSVIDFGLSLPDADPDRVILLGHSLGGAAAIHTAVEDNRVNKLVLWSPVANPFNDIVRIVGRPLYEEVLGKGRADYYGYGLTAGFFESLSKHHPFQEVKKFPGDVLLAHGTSDEVIPVDYSFLYQKVLRIRPAGHCDKEIIYRADHTYSSEDSVKQLIGKTIEWLGFTMAPQSYFI
ncbi:alpha/beta fold hydrolase [Paenibacillus aurantius]|uniref:Alpha/beta fold hydrolase n=1 Tax=Paenibacillus aurantius TaxID=2918900 RepID=A0AA96RG97_9BACL|nr:alpha/beta fold hydrolase [Paenibacillus aurantius]WJH32435.1 alpha/beta hydrolase [Paenibacillus sp. CC-CFT747]WNQ12837.1 alpha/beta fold hydrolase [Paenibacillus aurantius]